MNPRPDTKPLVTVSTGAEGQLATTDRPWNDQLEATQYMTKVFERIDKKIGTDLVLARLDPGQRRFIIDHTKHAFAMKKQIPDKNVGARVFTAMIAEVLMTAILHRNVDRNVLVEIVGGVRKDSDDQVMIEEETNALKKVQELVKRKFGKQEPQQLEGMQ